MSWHLRRDYQDVRCQRSMVDNMRPYHCLIIWSGLSALLGICPSVREPSSVGWASLKKWSQWPWVSRLSDWYFLWRDMSKKWTKKLVSTCFKTLFILLLAWQIQWELLALCWVPVLETGAPSTWAQSGHNCFRWTMKLLDQFVSTKDTEVRSTKLCRANTFLFEYECVWVSFLHVNFRSDPSQHVACCIQSGTWAVDC